MDILVAPTKTENRNQQTAAPLASASSSPSHEFSFTISLHDNPSMLLLPLDKSKADNSQTQSRLSSLTMVDLTPADDIFFHGHLLPLHHLPRGPSSPPRSSTNSLDSFTLPITNFLEEAKPNDTVDQNQNQNQNRNQNRNQNENNSFSIKDYREQKAVKSKSFSLSGLKRWRSKGQEEADKPERKLRISDVSQFITRMLKPLVFFKGSTTKKTMMMSRADLHDQGNGPPPRGKYSNSLSGNLASRPSRDVRSRDLRGRSTSGEFSAPASMRISPSNSGLLAAKAGMAHPASDSSMEELQAAIQAAIAHCKNSIAPHQNEKHKSEPTT